MSRNWSDERGNVSTYVLGINSYLHDASAALMRDGELIFATTEERHSRIKKDNRFPALSITAATSATVNQ